MTQDYAHLGGILAGTSYCSYRGITSLPIPNTAGIHSVDLKVPSGPERVIQMVGIVDAAGTECTKTTPLGSENGQDQTTAFEIGRVVTDLFTSQSVSLPDTFDTLSVTDQAAREMDCKEGNYFALIQSEPGLLGYWPLVDTSGVTATNIASSSPWGSLTYGAIFNLGLPGPLHSASLASHNFSVQLGAAGAVTGPAVMNFTGDLSVESWIKIPAGADCSGGGGLVFFTAGAPPYNRIFLNCTGLSPAVAEFELFDSAASTNVAEAPGSTLNDGNWHHVVGTWTSSPPSAQVYVDGVVGTTVGANALANIAIVTPAPLIQLGNGFNPVPSGTQLAHVAVYKSALTATQINAHYQAALSPY